MLWDRVWYPPKAPAWPITSTEPSKLMANDNRIRLGHGGGGRMTGRLIRELILPRSDRGRLAPLPDSVALDGLGQSIAFTTDSYVDRRGLFLGVISALLRYMGPVTT